MSVGVVAGGMVAVVAVAWRVGISVLSAAALLLRVENGSKMAKSQVVPPRPPVCRLSVSA